VWICRILAVVVGFVSTPRLTGEIPFGRVQVMKAIVYGILVLGAVGCGGNPFEPKATCQAAGLTFFLETSRDCSYYEALAVKAQALLVSNGFVTKELYNSKFVGLEVWIHEANRAILCQNAGSAGGCYHTGYNYIELTRSGGALAHELLHHMDHLQGLERLDHKGWGMAGHPDLTGHTYILKDEADVIYPGSWRDLTQRFYYAADSHFETIFGP
jgi:hypothetical protein